MQRVVLVVVGISLSSDVAHERDSAAPKVLKAKARETRLPLVNDHLLIRLCFIGQKGHESKQCGSGQPGQRSKPKGPQAKIVVLD